MHKPRRVTDVLGKIRREGDDIVVGRFLDLADARHGKRSLRLDLSNGIGGNRAHLGMNLTNRDLDIKPFLKLVFLRPDGAHLRQCVAFDHCGFLHSPQRALRLVQRTPR